MVAQRQPNLNDKIEGQTTCEVGLGGPQRFWDWGGKNRPPGEKQAIHQFWWIKEQSGTDHQIGEDSYLENSRVMNMEKQGNDKGIIP